LILWRRKLLKSEHELEGFISREGAFLLGNVLLTIMMLTTLVGTTFPILSGPFRAEPITVGEPFYNKIVAPMALVIVALMAMGPVLAFGKSAASKIARALMLPAIITAIVTVIVAIVFTLNFWALLCTAICSLGTFAVIVDFARTTSARRRSTGENLFFASLRLIDKDHRRYGGQFAHLGVMLLVIGVAGSSLFDVEETHRLQPGQSVMVDGNQLTFVRLDEKRMANYTAIQAVVALTDRDGRTFTLSPQRRFYDSWSDQPNSEVSILTTWKEDVYVSLAGWEDRGAITAIQVKINPLVVWIWIGGIVMVLGATFSALPRLLPQAKPAVARSAKEIGESKIQSPASAAVATSSLEVETSP
jgi:cytochrome c-type biogenesis protein CcmF